MEEHQIVPDVVDNAPPETLSVQYGTIEVNLGNEITPFDVKDEPKVQWNADSDSYYTIAMVDPDAPSRTDPKFREVLHWLVGNIKGSDIAGANHIAVYFGSGPPKGTGLHRYVFMLYKQPEKLTFDEPKSPKNSRANRFNFNLRNFVQKYKLGEPLAGNFFQAQWDEYVDMRNKHVTN